MRFDLVETVEVDSFVWVSASQAGVVTEGQGGFIEGIVLDKDVVVGEVTVSVLDDLGEEMTVEVSSVLPPFTVCDEVVGVEFLQARGSGVWLSGLLLARSLTGVFVLERDGVRYVRVLSEVRYV